MDYSQTIKYEAKVAFIVIVVGAHVVGAVVGLAYFFSMYQTVGL